jgi:hypothetical protein
MPPLVFFVRADAADITPFSSLRHYAIDAITLILPAGYYAYAMMLAATLAIFDAIIAIDITPLLITLSR